MRIDRWICWALGTTARTTAKTGVPGGYSSGSTAWFGLSRASSLEHCPVIGRLGEKIQRLGRWPSLSHATTRDMSTSIIVCLLTTTRPQITDPGVKLAYAACIAFWTFVSSVALGPSSGAFSQKCARSGTSGKPQQALAGC